MSQIGFRADRSVKESRYTKGGAPRALLLAHGVKLSGSNARELGYSISSPSNWQGAKRMPYAAYLAFIDRFGRDEHGALRAPLAAFVNDRRGVVALLPREVERYAAMDTLDGTPAASAAPDAAAVVALAPETPVKRKYTRRAGAMVRVPKMAAAQMAQTIEARAAYHVRNGHSNGNGHLPPEAFGVSFDVPRGFAGAHIEFRISPRTEATAH